MGDECNLLALRCGAVHLVHVVYSMMYIMYMMYILITIYILITRDVTVELMTSTCFL